MLPECSTPWRNPRVVTILLLVFLSGAVAGAVACRSGLFPSAARKSAPYWKEGGKEISLQRLRKDLSLTPSQAHQVETVLDDFMMYYQTLQSQMDEVRASGKDRILRILDEDQRRKFERLLDETQARQIR